MIGSVRFDDARRAAVSRDSAAAAIDRFGALAQAAARAAALQDTVARQSVAPRAYYAGWPPMASAAATPAAHGPGFETGRKLGAAAAAFFASEPGKAAMTDVAKAGKALVRDLFGLGAAVAGVAQAAASSAASAAEGAEQLVLPLIA